MSVHLKGRLATFINGTRTSDVEKEYVVGFDYTGNRIQLKRFEELNDGTRKTAADSVAAGALTAISPPSAVALQRVEARDGVSVEAAIALNEPTRIKIDGGAISDVFGNIYSTNCGATGAAAMLPNGHAAPAINPAGEVVLECDKERGEIYVKPVGPGAKPINLFVSSGKATYTLILKRVDMPADTIVIVDRTLARPFAANSAQVASHAPSHERALKAMLFAMAGDEVPSELRVEEVNQPVELWAEARFTLLRAFEGRGSHRRVLSAHQCQQGAYGARRRGIRSRGWRCPRGIDREPQPRPRREHQRVRHSRREQAMASLKLKFWDTLDPKRKQWALLILCLAPLSRSCGRSLPLRKTRSPRSRRAREHPVSNA